MALGIFLVLVASATSEGSAVGETTGGVTLPSAKAPRAQPDSSSAAVDEMTHDALRELRSELGLDADVTAASAERAIVRRMRLERATWYGPGFYGNRTACGLKLRRSTLGVAHKRLPCGTRVTFFHSGSFQTVPVIDRGPFTAGTSWDLTAAASRALDFRRSGRLRVIH